jgi:hypothetical protein
MVMRPAVVDLSDLTTEPDALGLMLPHPAPSERVVSGGIIVAMGRDADLRKLEIACRPH